jgi:DNA (cytosine-5)-methyltransferase 1
MKDPLFIVIDLFCGFGGTTLGFELAELESLKIAEVFACVNHDPKAIKSHWLNNKKVKHFNEDIRTLDLTELIALTVKYRTLYPNAKLILWASLECTNFSKAKGGLPRNADSRTLADHLKRYMAALKPDYTKVENVVEFMSWGPLDDKGRPVSKKSGSDWLRWRNELKAMGYVDEWRELNSANFGAYTSRNRLFGVFAKPELPIVWPSPTHAKVPSKMSMYGDMKKWMPVKDVLNFEDEGESIFTRKKPLSDNTLERIYAGLVKYIAKGDTAFISKYFSGLPSGMNTSTGQPAGSLTTVDHHSIVQAAFLTKNYSGKPDGKNIPVDGPAGTITTFGGSHALVQGKFLVKYNSMGKDGGYNPPSIEEPSPVISTQNRLYLAQPEFIVQRNGGNPDAKLVDVEGPARTLTSTGGNQELVQPQFLTHYYSGGGQISSIEDPCPTVTAMDGKAVVTPNVWFDQKTEHFLEKQYSKSQNQSIDDPAGTIMPTDKHRLVTTEPFIMPTAYQNQPKSVEEPAPTITASRRHHYLINPSWGGNPGSIEEPCCVIVARQDKAPLYFVQVEQGPVSIAIYDIDSPVAIRIKQFMAAYGLVDIKMRMLRVPELLKIQGFPEDYQMVGNQSDQKKFIGNSVVPHVVKAWAEAMGRRLLELNQKVA